MSLYQPDRLIGRSAEESILLNSYFASLSMGHNSPATVIIIRGDSGLGKTKLAETLRPHVVEDDGYFIQGKFDQLSYGSAYRPYSGIASAFAEYCSAVEERSQDTWNEVTHKLRQEIKTDEGKLLFQAIPSLRKIIGSECQQDEVVLNRRHSCDACIHYETEEEEKIPETLDSFSESSSHRLNYLIKRVVAIISSIGDPIVFLIDDIQWANKTEIDVLKALMTGAINPFMFIFTCRPGAHPFLKVTDDYGGKTEIMLQSLRRDSVRDMVAETLSIDNPDDCTSLANFISRVTDGNPLFVRQQIIALRDEGLLRFGDCGWVWDTEELEGIHDDVLDNVVVITLLLEKMKRLPSLTQHVLKICSCIGSRIDLYVLGVLLRETPFVEGSDAEDNVSFAKAAISFASQEGLLAVTPNGKAVAFTHDSVNEAAYSLLEPDRQASYHLKLGQTLHKNICPNLFRKYLFTIAAQLARGNKLITEEEDRISTVGIFRSAGEKSMSVSAFPEAHFFFAKGIDLLCESDWTNNYRLCCDIYMKDADTAAITGNIEDMTKCLTVLIDHCKGSIVDFLTASYIKARSLAAMGDPFAIDVGLEALRLAGEPFPTRNLFAQNILGLVRTKYSMRSIDAGKWLQLPPIKDEQMIATLRMLNLLVHISISYNQRLLPLLCFRIVELSLAHGMSNEMPSAVALYGAILIRRGLTESAKYGEIALTLQDKLMCKENMANVTFLTYGTTFTRTKKLSDLLKPLRAGYDSGIKTGQFAHATSCASVIYQISFFSGQRLVKVATTLDKLRTTMSEYNLTKSLKMNRLYRNAVDYCLGVKGGSGFLAVDSDDSIKSAHIIQNQVAKLLQLVVACIFCDHEHAWSMSENSDLRQMGPTFGGTIWPDVCAFYRGLAAMSMLRMSKSRPFIGTAKSCLKQLRKARKKRKESHISHQSYLLEAEYAAFRKNNASAEKFYKLAIEHAALAGVTHEHAYACERFGTYHLLQSNHNAAYEQIREAHRLYSQWGKPMNCFFSY
ncbi:hypothetical protein ACHAXR_010809 [Thalassiosira sp. AJA248-18]